MIQARQLNDNNLILEFNDTTIYPYLIILFKSNYSGVQKIACFENLDYAATTQRTRINIHTVLESSEDLPNGLIYLPQTGSWDITIYGSTTAGNVDPQTGVFQDQDELIVYRNNEYNAMTDGFKDTIWGGEETIIYQGTGVPATYTPAQMPAGVIEITTDKVAFVLANYKGVQFLPSVTYNATTKKLTVDINEIPTEDVSLIIF